MPPGHYDVTVTATGFGVYKETAVPLETGEARRLAVGLELGSIQTEVTVVAPLRRLDTDTPTKGEFVITSYSIHYTKLYELELLHKILDRCVK